MRTFNIMFYRMQKGDMFYTDDETQFDTRDTDFVEMFNDLITLWNKFVEENEFDVAVIDQIYEVPYDGEEE